MPAMNKLEEMHFFNCFGCVGTCETPTVASDVYALACSVVDECINRENSLQVEFESLQDDDFLGTFGDEFRNSSKNRYHNVVPFDWNRVRLGGKESCGYINASCMQDEEMECFIAAQGPLKATTADFWRMVVQHHVSTIVMLTREVENGFEKSADYFPKNPGDSAQHGPFTVTVTALNNLGADIQQRSLVVQEKQSSQSFSVLHYNYVSWPDFGVPDSTHSVRLLVRRLLGDGRGPEAQTVVHCSAGIGRTGTFLAVHILMKRLDEVAHGKSLPSRQQVEAALDVCSVVSGLRRQRRGMVQTFQQYLFVYRALLDEAEDGCTRLAAR